MPCRVPRSPREPLELVPAGEQALDLGAGAVEIGHQAGHLGAALLEQQRIRQGLFERAHPLLGGQDGLLDAGQLLLLLPGRAPRPPPRTVPSRTRNRVTGDDPLGLLARAFLARRRSLARRLERWRGLAPRGVARVVALVEVDLAVALEGEDAGRDPI